MEIHYTASAYQGYNRGQTHFFPAFVGNHSSGLLRIVFKV
jgi:hypothetical protein